jgi:hypothetical protein
MDDWLEFIGYYVSEGSCYYNKCNNGYQVRISQKYDSKYFTNISNVITKLGLRFTYIKADMRFVIHSNWLYSVLFPLGNSLTKRVPGYIQELCPRQLRIFFNAYMNGDGHWGKAWEFGTSSEKLMEDLQIICLKLGWAVRSVPIVPPSDLRKDNWQKSMHWRGRVNRKHLRPIVQKSKMGLYKCRAMQMVPYSGPVYCMTVPNHVIYVKREGKTYWSRNCGRYG